jgi:pSer/pThr/pTyr-binding forkhead associated (FHA) protein
MADDPGHDREETRVREIEIQAIDKFAYPHILEQLKGPGAPRNFALEKGEVRIGRASNADIQIDSLDLSRLHLSLTKRGSEWQCQDLDSANGVFLNGLRIHSAILRNGDHLQVGDVVLVFHEGS